MVENTCFICLNKISDDIYHFDESELENMTCDCYKHKSVHIHCFHAYLKKNTENKNKCAVCRSSILDNNKLLIEAIKGWKWGMELDTLSIMLLKKGVDVNAMDNDGITALMWASYLGYKEIVAMLLKKGADVNVKDRRNETALMRSAMSPTKWRLRQREIVSMLLEKGADVNAMDNRCFTALMWAYKRGNEDLLSILLDKGANVNGIASLF